MGAVTAMISYLLGGAALLLLLLLVVAGYSALVAGGRADRRMAEILEEKRRLNKIKL